MSDLLTAAAWTGIALLPTLTLLAIERRLTRKSDRRQQALTREQELREIENTPAYTIDPIIDSLPADIRKDFQ